MAPSTPAPTAPPGDTPITTYIPPHQRIAETPVARCPTHAPGCAPVKIPGEFQKPVEFLTEFFHGCPTPIGKSPSDIPALSGISSDVFSSMADRLSSVFPRTPEQIPENNKRKTVTVARTTDKSEPIDKKFKSSEDFWNDRARCEVWLEDRAPSGFHLGVNTLLDYTDPIIQEAATNRDRIYEMLYAVDEMLDRNGGVKHTTRWLEVNERMTHQTLNQASIALHMWKDREGSINILKAKDIKHKNAEVDTDQAVACVPNVHKGEKPTLIFFEKDDTQSLDKFWTPFEWLDQYSYPIAPPTTPVSSAVFDSVQSPICSPVQPPEYIPSSFIRKIYEFGFEEISPPPSSSNGPNNAAPMSWPGGTSMSVPSIPAHSPVLSCMFHGYSTECSTQTSDSSTDPTGFPAPPSPAVFDYPVPFTDYSGYGGSGPSSYDMGENSVQQVKWNGLHQSVEQVIPCGPLSGCLMGENWNKRQLNKRSFLIPGPCKQFKPRKLFEEKHWFEAKELLPVTNPVEHPFGMRKVFTRLEMLHFAAGFVPAHRRHRNTKKVHHSEGNWRENHFEALSELLPSLLVNFAKPEENPKIVPALRAIQPRRMPDCLYDRWSNTPHSK